MTADRDGAADEERTGLPAPKLASRVLVTWIELTAVGLAGGLLAETVTGPPGFVVYLATTLLAVGLLFYNVNELLERRLAAAT